jgi:polysaccharide biosynthesis protein PslG
MLVALACCGIGLAGPAAQASATGPARPAATPFLGGVNTADLGFNSTPADADRTISVARQLHAKVIRVELPWSVLEPRGAGRLDPHALAYTDRLLSDATANGIGVIAMIDSTPCWATSAPATLRARCVAGERNPANGWPPTNPADFAALVRSLAQRYGNRITALEVWNEPDQANEKYFGGPHKPERYAAILQAAYVAVKQVAPGIKVLGGSLVGPDGVFLRLLYKAGIKGYYDGLAIHFYTLSLAAVRATRAVQAENGDTAPLWLDEFGWPACYPRQRIEQEQACVTPSVQAHNITNIFRALAGTSYVAAAALYEQQDKGSDAFGVLTRRGSHRPSFSALAHVLASPIGQLSPVTLHLRKAGGRVIASGSGPIGDFMQLEVFRGSVLRYRAVFTLDRFNRYSIKLPRVLGKRGLRIRVYQYWTGVRHAAQKSI